MSASALRDEDLREFCELQMLALLLVALAQVLEQALILLPAGNAELAG